MVQSVVYAPCLDKTCLCYSNKKCSYKPVNPRSLIGAFARFKNIPLSYLLFVIINSYFLRLRRLVCV